MLCPFTTQKLYIFQYEKENVRDIDFITKKITWHM